MSVTVKGESVDAARMTAALSRLLPYCLQYVPNVEEVGLSGERVYTEKPRDIQEEMLSLAEGALGSKTLASFAINELLPALEGGEGEEALELVQKAYEKALLGGKKA